MVSPNAYQAQVMGKYLVYRGNHNAILYRYDADKRQLREFVYLKEAGDLPENGKVIEWRFEGVDLKLRKNGSVLLSKTVDLKNEVRKVSDNIMAERISRFLEKRYGKESLKRPVEQSLFTIPPPVYVSKSGEIRNQGIHYRVKDSSLAVIMASRAPLAFPLWVDPTLLTSDDALFLQAEQGANLSDSFGHSVAPAGDFNGDGIDDIIVSNDRFTDGTFNISGAAYIYFGGQTDSAGELDVEPDLTVKGGIPNVIRLGVSVASAGDFNGDGIGDVIIGAALKSFFTPSVPGKAFIFFGGGTTGTLDDPENQADVVLVGQVNEDRFGSSVASAGDFNGDGLDDVIVGASYERSDPSQPGKAYIFFGGQTGTITNPDTNANVILNGQGASDEFGWSVASAGDFNGDGLSDVIVAAPGDDNNGLEDSGSAFIFFGGQTGTIPDPDTNADVVLNGQVAEARFGYSVASAGDFNGDGLDDVIVGMFSAAGRAFIFFGGRTGTINDPETNADVVMKGPASFGIFGKYFGLSVGSAGDFNGDGLDDVIVGGPPVDAEFGNGKT